MEKTNNEEKRTIGGAFPSEPKPNACHVCGKQPIVTTTQSFMGQYLFGLCEEHKDCFSTWGCGKIGIARVNKKTGKYEELI